ncbi:MAG: aminoglycoside phosphotransferase family protein, partial [Myxococcota bacterium]
TLGAGDAPRSVALMVLLGDDRGIKSDEIVELEADSEELPFVNVQRHLSAFTDAVPEIYHYDQEHGLMYLEDLGDTLFEEVVKPADDAGRRRCYGRALDLLIRLQTEGTRRLRAECVASRAAFTETLFLWEFEHFIEYGYGTKTGRRGSELTLGVLRAAFGDLARRLAQAPRVFTHRDFQSRNLIVQNERLRLIDFQDALMGPATYDLVALLRDSYVELGAPLIDQLLGDYLDRLSEASSAEDPEPPEPPRFREEFARMTLQRKLKDYGRFIYIDRVKGNPDYLRYNPANARYILDAAARIPELGEARRILEAELSREAGR